MSQRMGKAKLRKLEMIMLRILEIKTQLILEIYYSAKTGNDYAANIGKNLCRTF